MVLYMPRYYAVDPVCYIWGLSWRAGLLKPTIVSPPPVFPSTRCYYTISDVIQAATCLGTIGYACHNAHRKHSTYVRCPLA